MSRCIPVAHALTERQRGALTPFAAMADDNDSQPKGFPATDKNETDMTKWARWPSPKKQITGHSVRQATDSSSFCNFLLYTVTTMMMMV
jgi:hypothetical protein